MKTKHLTGSWGKARHENKGQVACVREERRAPEKLPQKNIGRHTWKVKETAGQRY